VAEAAPTGIRCFASRVIGKCPSGHAIWALLIVDNFVDGIAPSFHKSGAGSVIPNSLREPLTCSDLGRRLAIRAAEFGPEADSMFEAVGAKSTSEEFRTIT